MRFIFVLYSSKFSILVTMISIYIVHFQDIIIWFSRIVLRKIIRRASSMIFPTVRMQVPKIKMILKFENIALIFAIMVCPL